LNPDKMIMPEDKKFTLKDFNFNLPPELIAQYPSARRDESRLFVLNRSLSGYQHKSFYQIKDFLRAGDVLIANSTKVIPARMFFKRISGGLVEIVLTQRLSGSAWLAVSNRTKRLKPGETLQSDNDPSVEFTVQSRVDDFFMIEFNRELTVDVMERIGQIPLPPYIKREASSVDRERYQTVYARNGNAAAAPTAGLHFTDELITELKSKGIIFVYVNLDVSWGTFQPVRNNDISKHKMHSEKFDIPEQTAHEINNARKEKRRLIAVGTTALRVLESTYKDGINSHGSGETDIFIYPPCTVKSIDAMITNFHTPESTLLMLVSAFGGYNRIMDAYRIAVVKKYRFFSYGDSMLIL
jgi:S-adenosylmethionine:tRNA ribosyltransferase-isomerase